MQAVRVRGSLRTLGVLLTLGAGLSLIAWLSSERTLRLEDELRRAGLDSARAFAAAAAGPARAGDGPALRALALALAAAPGVRSAAVLDPEWRPLAHAGAPALHHPPRAATEGRDLALTSARSHSLVIQVPVALPAPQQSPDRAARPSPGVAARAGRRLGWVQLELPRSAVRRARIQALSAGLAAALLLMAAPAWWLSRARIARRAPRSAGPPTTPRRSHAAGAGASARPEGTPGDPSLGGATAPTGADPPERAARARRADSTFMASVSHEIRTPMSSVIGYCDLLLKTRLNPVQREFTQTIRESSEGLLRVVDRTLAFARTEANVAPPEAVALDIRECVEDVLALLAPGAYRKNLELASFISPHVPPRVRGDPDRVRQILVNLVGNALKFTERGSVVVRATVTAGDATGIVVLFSITDTGIGLEERRRPHLFEPFSRARSTSPCERPGTGLGLAISKALTRSLGGEIGVESVPGRGSTFWFTMRCEKCADPIPAAPPRSALEGRHALLYGRGKLTRAALREMLKSWGMQVHELARRGELAAAQRSGPGCDVAILDLSRGRGAELTLQRLHGQHRVPVLAILSGAEPAPERIGDIASACLFQPVRHRELHAALTRLLSTRAQARAPAAQPALEDANGALAGLRVLLADDDAVNRKLMLLLLRPHGVGVAVARDGAEALQRAREARFDAILMDVCMPELDGMEVTRRLRAGEGGQRTPIIALSADATAETRTKLLACGMDDCLVKPVGEARLQETLARWVARAATAAPASRAAERSGGKPAGSEAVARELYAMLLGELPERRARINEALARGDLDTVRFEAHALTGGAACCDVPALKRTGRMLERAAGLARTAQVARQVQWLNHEIDRLLEREARTPGVECGAGVQADSEINVRLSTKASSRPSRAG